MANKRTFKSTSRGKTPAPADTVNEAGGRAFTLPSRHALAQFAATGTLNDTYYTSGEDQLKTVLGLLAKNDPEFVAKAAVYVREHGSMKDMPALFCAHLTTRAEARPILKKVFPRIINNGKMLRNFVQIMRSGQVGRKSMGSAPRKLVRQWFETRTDDAIFKMSVGNDPSFGDIIKMVHPKPATPTRRALFAYLIGHEVSAMQPDGTTEKLTDLLLPQLVLEYEHFKAAKAAAKKSGNGKSRANLPLPKVPWEMLEGLDLSEKDWRELAKQASWTQTRMNLNTFVRHDVFKDREMIKLVAEKLRDKELVEKAKPFPYQLLAAYLNTMPERSVYNTFRKGEGGELPTEISDALQDALELSTKNVPVVEGKVVVCPDVSGSMSSPITGVRTGATTKMRCIDIAALVACVFLRKNPDTVVLPFEGRVVGLRLNGRDSVMTNAQKLGGIGGGSTNCAAPLHLLNQEKAKADLVLFVSDYESWVDSQSRYGYGGTTGMLGEWNAFKVRNPNAKLVCINIQPNRTVQAQEDKDILNIGGFSDSVFEQVTRFVQGTMLPEHWVGVIEAIDLGPDVVYPEAEDRASDKQE